jgi:isoleucyl-tRNA synthetase
VVLVSFIVPQHLERMTIEFAWKQESFKKEKVFSEIISILNDRDIVCPVDAIGHFTKEVTDFAGMYVKDPETDKKIEKKLKEAGRFVHGGRYRHSYPFCWRSDTPLIYKAVPSWFVAVEKIKDKLVENNKKTYWYVLSTL